MCNSQRHLKVHLSFQVIIPCSWLFGVILETPAFILYKFDREQGVCIFPFPEEWMDQTYSLAWFLVIAFLPVSLMVALYSRIVYTLWFKRTSPSNSTHRQQV